MHITDKEKKAIYEAMKQIRENQKEEEELQEQLPTNTKAMNTRIKRMIGQGARGKGAMYTQDLDNLERSGALGASYYGSGVFKSYDADVKQPGMRPTEAQMIADMIKRRGSGTFKASRIDNDYANIEKGMMKPYMQAHHGKGRQR